MPILMTAVVPGLDSATYEHIMSAVGDSLRAAPGFRSHAAYDGEGGWTVVEIWDSESEWRTYYDANIAEQMPPEATQHTIDVHNVFMR